MTPAQFYKKLEAYRDKFDWEFLFDDGIRGECDGLAFCPITALYYAETGVYESTCFASKIGAQQFNLDPDFIGRVMSSADNERNSVEYSKYTRNRLMQAVGLK